MAISVIKKRDGRIAPFDVQRISNALRKSFWELDPSQDWRPLCDKLAWDVYTRLDQEDDPAPRVEHIQDTVFQILTEQGYRDAARRYLLFRQKRNRIERSDASDLRFGGEGLYLFDELADADSIDQAVLWAYVALRDNHYPGQRVMDLAAALTPGVQGTFARCYRAVLPWSFQLRTGMALHPDTLAACAQAAETAGALTKDGPGGYDEREADLLCGTLGCDRTPVEEAQAQARAWAYAKARTRTVEALTDLLTELEALDCRLEDFGDFPDQIAFSAGAAAAALASLLFPQEAPPAG